MGFVLTGPVVQCMLSHFPTKVRSKDIRGTRTLLIRVHYKSNIYALQSSRTDQLEPLGVFQNEKLAAHQPEC